MFARVDAGGLRIDSLDFFFLFCRDTHKWVECIEWDFGCLNLFSLITCFLLFFFSRSSEQIDRVAG